MNADSASTAMDTKRRPAILIAAREFRRIMRSTFHKVFIGVLLVLVGFLFFLTSTLTAEALQKLYVSVFNLIQFLVPLFVMLAGYQVFTEPHGSFQLLLSQPIRRKTIYQGKLLGILVIVLFPVIILFGLLGMGIGLFYGYVPFTGYIGLIVVTTGLVLFFTLLSGFTFGIQHHPERFLGMSLAGWILFVLGIDLFVIGLSVILPYQYSIYIFWAGTSVNPVALLRLGLVLLLGQVEGLGSVSTVLALQINAPAVFITGAVLLFSGLLVLIYFLGRKSFQTLDL